MKMRLLRSYWAVRYSVPWLAVLAVTVLLCEAVALSLDMPAHRWASMAGWATVLVMYLRGRRT